MDGNGRWAIEHGLARNEGHRAGAESARAVVEECGALGIDTLILTGVAADQCVLATAIDAADRGFHVILATDAVANLDPGSAEATQILFGRIWGYVMTTADILHWLQTGEPPERTRLSV